MRDNNGNRNSDGTAHRQGGAGHRARHRHRVRRGASRDLQRGPHRFGRQRRLRKGGRRGGGRAAPGREPGAHRGHEADRRHDARHDRHRHRRAHPGACGSRDAGTCAERPGRARGLPGPAGAGERALAHSPAGADARGAVHRAEDVRDRHQGDRPAGAVSPGRQDRALRRRRRGQDRHHHGAHQQHRHEARRCVGVRRRGRTHARGQRPLARVPGIGRHRHRRTCRSRAPRWSTAR